MTNYKEILRLQSLGINNTRIAEACGCARSTVISTLQYATAKGLKWDSVRRAAGLQILYGIIEADGQVSAAAPGSRLQQSFFFHGITKSQKHTVHTAFRTGQTARAGSGKILHLSIRFHTRSRIL